MKQPQIIIFNPYQWCGDGLRAAQVASRAFGYDVDFQPLPGDLL
ncbi:MAG: hypothetical protein OXG92_08605 [Chloroflexi bacterium]|nr:hypothetical protein [Chloroflexota bacterium]MCY3581863.1 hypothetical protein [Chloroflexota bacterium]MCY3716509.1 hypothetical protein [Chloroflexota bacterium]MDE2651603.1 hypothetical protein [Chloroflexota bacterium]